MRTVINPEDRACLLLAQGQLSFSEGAEINTLLSSPLQWDQILERSLQHEVYPLVFRNLKASGFPGVPVEVRSRLQILFQTNALRNELLAEELAVVLRTLHAAGIPAIPLKGIPLAESLYGDKSLRVCTDLDILVPRRSVEQSFNLLVATGYHAGFPRWILKESMMCNSIECALRRQEKAMDYLVELHWSFLLEPSSSERTMHALWADARPESYRGVSITVLRPEWELLHLLAHAARHNWQGLKWLVDIHQVCVTQSVQWDLVLEKAREAGWDHLVRWGLSICNITLNTPLPREVPFELPQPSPRLFPALPLVMNSWQRNLALLRLARKPSQKVRLLARRTLVPTLVECELWPLPGSLTFLYYLLRPLRVIYLMGRAMKSTAA